MSYIRQFRKSKLPHGLPTFHFDVINFKLETLADYVGQATSQVIVNADYVSLKSDIFIKHPVNYTLNIIARQVSLEYGISSIAEYQTLKENSVGIREGIYPILEYVAVGEIILRRKKFGRVTIIDTVPTEVLLTPNINFQPAAYKNMETLKTSPFQALFAPEKLAILQACVSILKQDAIETQELYKGISDDDDSFVNAEYVRFHEMSHFVIDSLGKLSNAVDEKAKQLVDLSRKQDIETPLGQMGVSLNTREEYKAIIRAYAMLFTTHGVRDDSISKGVDLKAENILSFEKYLLDLKSRAESQTYETLVFIEFMSNATQQNKNIFLETTRKKFDLVDKSLDSLFKTQDSIDASNIRIAKATARGHIANAKTIFDKEQELFEIFKGKLIQTYETLKKMFVELSDRVLEYEKGMEPFREKFVIWINEMIKKADYLTELDYDYGYLQIAAGVISTVSGFTKIFGAGQWRN